MSETKPCSVCEFFPSWYLVGKNQFCKDHKKEADAAALIETRQHHRWHLANNKDLKDQAKRGDREQKG